MAEGSTRGRPKSKPQESEIPVMPTADAVEQTSDKNVRQPKAFNPNQVVTVINGFQGRLIYKSKRTGERYVWDEFGAEQDMELSELKSARSSSKRYFIDNWFMFDDPEIAEYLMVSQYYKFALNASDFDKVFDKEIDDLVDTIQKLSDGQKKSIAYRAKQMIADGTIDSNKKITALEKCLGIELVER